MRIGRTGSLAGGVFVLLATAATGTLGAQQAGAAGAAVITGRVQAEGGVTLPAANVLIPEMNISVATNENGQYTITIPAERVRGQTVTIRARAIGHAPASQQIGVSAGRRTVDFSLRRDVNRLSEVVVTGVAAATERIKVPFAVTRIDSTQTPVPGVNPLTQLQGKVPGANIVVATGRPGAQPQVLLRGPKSINATGRSQDPLYIVDGVVLSSGIADVNALEIESVEVVKGAAAASLYGSQAANGVIQITTKRGRSARDGVRFGTRIEYGVNDVEREIGIAQRHALLMDASQTRFCIANGVGTGGSAVAATCQRTVDWVSEALRINDNTQDFASAPPQMAIDPGSALSAYNARRLYQSNPWPGANYNAVQQMAEPGPLAIANVDMTGKFGGADVFAALNTTQQAGSIQFLDGYTRNSARLNANQNIGSAWQIGVNSYFSRAEEDGFNQQGGGQAFFRLTRTPPIVDLLRRDSRGRLLVRPNIQNGGAQNENALYTLENNRRVDFINRFLGAVSARYTPATWISADANFGYDNADQDGRRFMNRGFRTTGPTASPANNNGQLFNYSQNRSSLNGSLGVTFPNISRWQSLVLSPSVRTQYLQRDFRDRSVSGQTLSVSDVEDTQNAAQSTLTTTAERTSERQLTYSGGLRAELNERYILDANVRRDGNSTFGSDERWATYYRIAGSWIASNEGFMQGISDKVDLLKFTANYGTSGLTPPFSAQYETYEIGSGGTLTPNRLGNSKLKPQVDQGSELGIELGLFRALNLTATYAQSNTIDQILPVPIPFAQGFREQWQNAGTLQNKTWELSLGFPIVRRGTLDWSGRLNYENTRTTVTKLNIPPYFTGGTLQATTTMFRVAEGERFGTFYGRSFATECAHLPTEYAAQCGGAGSAFQKNSDGFVVWVGEGNGVGDGVTKNLWNAILPGKTGVYPIEIAWGHPIVQRDTLGAALSTPLGQALPKFRWAGSTNLNWGKLTAFGLVDAAVGQSVYNQGRHWSYLDFLSKDQDQTGRSAEDIKPASYYYRAPLPDGTGIGGLYDVLGPNNYFTEKSSYAKLREVTLQYRFGRLGLVGGDWTVGVTGRNLYTWTDYKGFDPEVGLVGTQAGTFGSGALTAVDAFTFPNLRSFSFNVSTRF